MGRWTGIGIKGLMTLLIAGGLAGCAPRHAATTWGYSHWYERYGGGMMGDFDQRQGICLDQVGVADDPGSVAPGSSKEKAFLECMNEANWCTTAFRCEDPGA